MASCYFNPAVGGDGSTVSDDANPTTGLDAGGHRTRFVPALAQIVAIGQFVVTQALAAAASAAAAVNAPGTSATSTTSMAVGTGSKAFVLTQTGKQFAVGQTVNIADNAAPSTKFMIGIITAFNSGTGAITVNVSTVGGAGTLASWTISLSAVAGVPLSRTVTGGGLVTGGGDFSANRVLTVTAAVAGDVRSASSNTVVLTPGSLTSGLAEVVVAYAATITMTMGNLINGRITLTGNTTLANPSIAATDIGKSGRIYIVQDATGSRTMAFGSYFKWENNVTGVLSTAINSKDILYYDIVSTTEIVVSLKKAVP